MSVDTTVDTIGGFPFASAECKGCGNELKIENAWMTDGCPCNTPLGVNSLNETRWRLLMQLQQKQSQALGEKDKVIMAERCLNDSSLDEQTIAELRADNERLKNRLLSAAGDDLCRLTQDEIKELSSGAVKIPPKEEFLASCERFHAQIAKESGVLEGCMTLAQSIAEIEKLKAEAKLLDHENELLSRCIDENLGTIRGCIESAPTGWRKDQCMRAVEAMQAVWDQIIPPAPAQSGEGKMQCPECSGSGDDHPASYAYRNSEHGTECPRCQGTGVVAATAQSGETGKPRWFKFKDHGYLEWYADTNVWMVETNLERIAKYGRRWKATGWTLMEIENGGLVEVSGPDQQSLELLEKPEGQTSGVRRESDGSCLEAAGINTPGHAAGSVERHCHYCEMAEMGCYYDQNCSGCIKRMGASK